MIRAPLDLDDPQHPYRQVAARLRVAIETGALPVGERLKSVRELAQEHGVSPGTVQQALRLLRDEGLITTWQGRGTFVRSQSGDTVDDPATPTADERVDEILDRLERLEGEVAELKRNRS